MFDVTKPDRRQMTDMPNELEDLEGRLKMLEDEVAFLYKHLDLPFEQGSEDQAVIDLIRKNDLTGALKLYREIHVCSVDEARAGIRRLQEQPGF